MKKMFLLLPLILLAKNYNFCTSCHNGRKEVNLNSLKKSFIKKRLNELKHQKNTMGYIAKSLSKKDIKEILKIYGKE